MVRVGVNDLDSEECYCFAKNYWTYSFHIALFFAIEQASPGGFLAGQTSDGSRHRRSIRVCCVSEKPGGAP